MLHPSRLVDHQTVVSSWVVTHDSTEHWVLDKQEFTSDNWTVMTHDSTEYWVLDKQEFTSDNWAVMTHDSSKSEKEVKELNLLLVKESFTRIN